MLKRDYKIIVVGAGDFSIYEKALYNAFLALGYSRTELILSNDYYNIDNPLLYFFSKVEFRYGKGLQTTSFNKSLVEICRLKKPDIVFLYTCRMVLPKTVLKLKKMGIYIASYCNDDPFSRKYRKSFWRNYRDALKYCNINYVYRESNIKDVEKCTGRAGSLLRSYYIEEQNYPCEKNEIISDVPDVIFLGHIEADERLDYLETLLDKGVKIGLNRDAYHDWAKGKDGIVFLEKPRDLYNNYLCSCKIPLVFLSKLNRDTYTRRCFEIPAAKAFLLCPYTEDLASMFTENKEIIFYRTKEDFVKKVLFYINHDSEREKIARAGYERVIKDGHEIKDRAKTIIQDYERVAFEK